MREWFSNLIEAFKKFNELELSDNMRMAEECGAQILQDYGSDFAHFDDEALDAFVERIRQEAAKQSAH